MGCAWRLRAMPPTDPPRPRPQLCSTCQQSICQLEAIGLYLVGKEYSFEHKNIAINLLSIYDFYYFQELLDMCVYN